MSKPRILMISMAMLLSAIGCVFTMVGGNTSQPFATEPWLDSSICSTDWYQEPIGDGTQDWQAILSERITRLDLELELITVRSADSRYGPCYQTYPPQIHAIELSIQVPSHIIQDDEALGYRIRRLILLLEAYHDDLGFRDHSLLTIYFRTPDYQYERWSFPFSQALRAIDAHLSSPELFELGNRQY